MSKNNMPYVTNSNFDNGLKQTKRRVQNLASQSYSTKKVKYLNNNKKTNKFSD